MMKKLLLSMSVAGSLALASCATIFSNTDYSVNFQSNQPDVVIKVSDANGNVVYNGKTPISLGLTTAGFGYFQKPNYQVEVYKDNKLISTKTVEATISGWYIVGNLFSFSALGWLVVDPLTGAMYNLPSSVVVDGVDRNVGSVNFIPKDKLTAEQQAQLIPLK